MYRLNDGKMFFDMADNQAIIIDSTTGVYYAMNTLASVVFEQLTKAANPGSMIEVLEKLPDCPADIAFQLEAFIEQVLEKELLLPCDQAAEDTVLIPAEALVDGFVFELDVFTDAQDIMMADPVHDVEIGQGWPVLKRDDQDA